MSLRTYITKKALPMNWYFKLIDKTEFAKAALDKNFQVFESYINSLIARMTICSAKKA